MATVKFATSSPYTQAQQHHHATDFRHKESVTNSTLFVNIIKYHVSWRETLVDEMEGY